MKWPSAALLLLMWMGFGGAGLPPPERSYKVLVLLPVGSKSHRNVFVPLVEALADRGHKIDMLTSYDIKHKNSNIQEIPHGLPHYPKAQINMFDEAKRTSGIIGALKERMCKMARDIYQVPHVKELYRRRKEYDIIIIDHLFHETMKSSVFVLCMVIFVLSNNELQTNETEKAIEEAAVTPELRTTTKSRVLKNLLLKGCRENYSLERDHSRAGVVIKVILRHLDDFRFTVIDSADSGGFISGLIRDLHSIGKEVRIVNPGSWKALGARERNNLLGLLWKRDCKGRMAILMYLSRENAESNFRFLEETKFWHKFEIYVVILGAEGLQSMLDHPSLRNALHALYIGFSEKYMSKQQSSYCKAHTIPENTNDRLFEGESELIKVYRRCLYCDKTISRVAIFAQDKMPGGFPHLDEIISARPRNLHGLQIRISALPYLPFSGIAPSEAGGFVMTDSLDKRIVDALSGPLNFTYVILPPKDGMWGLPLPNGSWAGIIGALARQEADMSLHLSPFGGRFKVIDITLSYTGDITVLVTRKPGSLPKSLALLRPYHVNVWVPIMFTVLIITFTVWILWRARCSYLGGRCNSISEAFVLVWRTLLQNSGIGPECTTDQVMMGFWIICSFVLVSAYQSSLMSHLAVNKKSKPINSLEDLTSREGWRWVAEKMFFTSQAILDFRERSDPAAKKFLSEVQEMDIETACRQILEGDLAMLSWNNYINSIISMNYSDGQGRNPYHISPSIHGGKTIYIWGFRKGAPFQSLIQDTLQRLFESGFMDHALKRVGDDRRFLYRMSTELGTRTRVVTAEQDESESRVVLDLNHLQGAFVALLLGISAATIVFVAEIGSFRWKRSFAYVDGRSTVAWIE
ncbi:uncharacterized protein [Palaemon carinicauda]|uniref:uncharacterized protein n=1 Tax=Palaemon carinicauda TaxID=392227 RepID=UPI0035B584F7